MNYSSMIKENLRTAGQPVTVVRGGTPTTVFAVVGSRRRKTKTLFEDHTAEAGRYYNDYYTYIGPADTDITALSAEDYIEFGGQRYALIQAEGITAAGEILYYEGILKRIWEEEDVFTTRT